MRKQCPNCLGPMDQVGSEGATLPDGAVETRDHWQCRTCGQRAVDTDRRPPPGPGPPGPARSADGGARRAEVAKLNQEINRLRNIAMFEGARKADLIEERCRALQRRRDAVVRAEKERRRADSADRARKLAHEAGPLGQLDLAIDRVRAVGRGEPWAADDPHWTEKPVTDRQAQFLESRGCDAVPGTRGEASRLIGRIKEREANPRVTVHGAGPPGAAGILDKLDRLDLDRMQAVVR